MSVALNSVNGLAEKIQGLTTEVVGTVLGQDQWKQRGRDLQAAGSKRLDAVEQEAKARKEGGKAKANAAVQRSAQA